jgi:hypothetical protein
MNWIRDIRDHVWNSIARHSAIIMLVIAIALLGGFTQENFAVLRSAALAEAVALALSSFAKMVYTSNSFTKEESLNASARLAFAVHVLVGLVYAGSFFVAFSPSGSIAP